MRTERTNCTTRGRKEATSWKVGGAVMSFQREKNLGCCKGEGALIMAREQRGEREREWWGEREKAAFRKLQEKNISLKPFTGKTRRADYLKFL